MSWSNRQKNVTVSVVVPIHNTAVELVERALTSALTQEIDEGIIELVVIDDASTDKKVENYLKQLRGVKHSRNSHQLGVGKSKELGGHLSQGRFLFFLDADDEIPPGAIRALLRGADNYDIVDGVIETVSISGIRGVHRNFPGEDYSRHTHLQDLFQRKRSGMLQGSLYSRRLLDKGCFSVVSPNLHDDLVQRAKAVMASTSISYCDTVSYIYHRRADSLTGVPSFPQCLACYRALPNGTALSRGAPMSVFWPTYN